MAVDLLHHRVPTVAEFARDRIHRDRRALVERLEPGGAVRVTEHLAANLSRLPSRRCRYGIEELSKVGQHRLLARSVRWEQETPALFAPGGDVGRQNLCQLRPHRDDSM